MCLCDACEIYRQVERHLEDAVTKAILRQEVAQVGHIEPGTNRSAREPRLRLFSARQWQPTHWMAASGRKAGQGLVLCMRVEC